MRRCLNILQKSNASAPNHPLIGKDLCSDTNRVLVLRQNASAFLTGELVPKTGSKVQDEDSCAPETGSRALTSSRISSPADCPRHAENAILSPMKPDLYTKVVLTCLFCYCGTRGRRARSRSHYYISSATNAHSNLSVIGEHRSDTLSGGKIVIVGVSEAAA